MTVHVFNLAVSIHVRQARFLGALLCLSCATQILAAEDNELIEEIVVEGVQTTLNTEMEADTAKLIKVPGASQDPIQAIFSLPGVTQTDGFGGGEPVIRGSAPEDNVYFIDDIEASYIFHPFGNSIVSKHILRDFTLYPAAYPAQYSGATGGVIDVALRDPKNQELTTTLEASFLYAGAMVESALTENSQFYASYRRSTIDLIFDADDITDEEDVEEEGISLRKVPSYSDYQLKYVWEPSSNYSLKLVAAGADDIAQANFNENFSAAQRDPDFLGDAEIDTGFDSQGLILDWANNSDRSAKFLLTHINDSRVFTYGRGQFQRYDSDRWIGRFFFDKKLNEKNTLNFGGSSTSDKLDIDLNAKFPPCSALFDADCPTGDLPIVRYTTDLTINSQTAFIENTQSLTTRQNITYGIHVVTDDYIKETLLEPRARWEMTLSEKWKTDFSVGRYSQIPQLIEIIPDSGNPDLERIKATHFVFGLENSFSDAWSWSSDIYYKDLDDVVISDNETGRNYTNNAKGRAYGVELVVNREETDDWFAWASLSLSRTERTDKRNNETYPYQYDRPIIFNLVFNKQFSEKWSGGFKWTFQSGSRYTPIIDTFENPNNPGFLEPVYSDDINNEAYDPFHRLDVRIEYLDETQWGYIKFFADILNFYNYSPVTEYEFVPDGENTIDNVPDGFGENVPLRQEKDFSLIPSIGIEVQF